MSHPILSCLLACSFLSSGCHGRYLREVRPSPPVKRSSGEAMISDGLRSSVTNSVASANEMKETASIEEVIHLTAHDLVLFTVTFKQGKVTFTEGAGGESPTLVIPVTERVMGFLETSLADKALSHDELHNIAFRVVAPCLKRILEQEYFFRGPALRYAFDNFFQLEIKAPEGWTYHGIPLRIGATVVNVDGYFHVMDGLEGDPDTRLEVSVDEAIELYRRMVYMPPTFGDDEAANKANIKAVRELIASNLAYERSWH